MGVASIHPLDPQHKINASPQSLADLELDEHGPLVVVVHRLLPQQPLGEVRLVEGLEHVLVLIVLGGVGVGVGVGGFRSGPVASETDTHTDAMYRPDGETEKGGVRTWRYLKTMMNLLSCASASSSLMPFSPLCGGVCVWIERARDGGDV